jgi:mannose-6-phosphate isomerase-like protein (cupin superfamily)
MCASLAMPDLNQEVRNMTHAVVSSCCAATLLGFLTGYALSPAGSVSGQAAQAAPNQTSPAAPAGGALPPGDYSRMPLAPDQGEPTLFAGAAMRRAHVELQARAAQRGQPIANPRDLLAPMVTRTHSYILMHRPAPAAAVTVPGAEQHEGVTDIYIVVAGSGTVTVGGSIENKRVPRPGEYLGPIAGGRPFRLEAGDVLNIPPNVPHATEADPGGMTYVLMKVNVGLYPWSLINGTP